MRHAVRSIPLRVSPGEGESFASYMNRLAHHANAPLTALMKATGTVDEESFASLPPGYGITLTPARLAAFSYATGIPENEVSTMLLTAYDGTVCDLSGLDPEDRNSFRETAVKQWAYFVGSHVCPKCIEETGGVWRLAWKLPWSFACVRHGNLLVDTCPSCEKRIGVGRQDGRSAPAFPSLVPDPVVCRNTLPAQQTSQGRAARPCGHSLAETPAKSLKDHRRLLEAQERLDRAMAGDTAVTVVAGESVASLEYFRDLRSLIAFLLSYGTTGDVGEMPRPARDAFKEHTEERERIQGERKERQAAGESWQKGPRMRPYTGAPESAALMAAVTPAAVELLAAGAVEDMANGLQPIVDRMRREVGQPRQRFKYFGFSERLEKVFDKCLEPYAKTANRLGGAGAGAAREFPGLSADHVPQLFWAREFETSFREFLPDIRDNNARRFSSMWLVKLIEDCTWTEAAGRLDLPPKPAYGMANKAIWTLNQQGNSDLFAERLREVAHRLEDDTARVDYGSRRRSLSEFTEIPDEKWAAICEEAGVLKGKAGGKRRYAAAWVWCEVTGGDYTLAPALQEGKQENMREMYRRFEKRDLDRLYVSLDVYANNLLDISEKMM